MPDQNFLKQDTSDAKGEQGKTGADKDKKQLKRKSIFRRKELGVNLMSPDVIREVSRQVERKNLFQVLVSFLVAVGIVGLAYGGIFLYDFSKASERAAVDARLTVVNEEITALETNTSVLTVFQDTLGSIRTLLEKHVYWTQFLAALEKATLQTVKYDSISVSSGSNTLTLGALTDSYQIVGKQIRAFQNASSTFPTVSVNSANAILDQAGDISGLTFSVSLTYNEEILTQNVNAPATKE